MIRAIDVHTHVFNLKYLPVAAILDRSGLFNLPGDLARALAKAALALTKDDPTLDDVSSAGPSPGRASEAAAEAQVDAGVKEIEFGLADFGSYLDSKEEELPDWVREDEDVRSALESPGAELSRSGVGEGTLRRLVAAAEAFLGNARQRLKWVFVVATQSERAIVRRMITTYGGDVETFVHHMMNMASFYREGETVYPPHPRQVNRMRKLGEAYPGRLITFTAWDPFGDHPDQLEAVKDAVTNRGARGVKIYPPSGYRPIGNGPDNRHPHVSSPAPEEIDRRNLALFRWCVDEGVPVFTHCTDEGFEAYVDAGELNASPEYWRRLLASEGMAELKLCLGHAGGDAWFGTDAEFNCSFAADVVRLCTDSRFPNVCCEFGILDHVQDQAQFNRVRDRLGAIVAEQPGFGSRILYGSDWHMLFMRSGHEEFFRNYKRLFADPVLARHSENFFRGNAVRYLERQ
ncbi:amidohydrolase family protein [Allosphingosinicella sp.]|jgi:predicted TIM-barrel fold metal-dependent hydrolase|uniref:amidohydrolase family protein n=1 Tax=Allosphingosinicella sp. TaxID=2823234 RepID=UPI002F022305